MLKYEDALNQFKAEPIKYLRYVVGLEFSNNEGDEVINRAVQKYLNLTVPISEQLTQVEQVKPKNNVFTILILALI